MKCLGRANVRFTNWAGTYSCVPESYFEPEDEEQIRQIIAEATQKQKRVKVVGCGHSPSNIMCTTDYMISMKNFNKILHVDKENRLVTVQAGTRLDFLNEELPKLGLCLPVQGAVSDVTIGGVVATGTHGSASQGGIIGSFMEAAKVMNGLGEVLSCSVEENGDLLRALQCNLGALGVVLEVTMRCVPTGNYEETRFGLPWKQVVQNMDSICDENDFAECFVYPHCHYAQVVQIKSTKQTVRDTPSWFWDTFVGFHLLQFLLYISTFFPVLVPWITYVYYFVLFRTRTSRVNRLDKVLNFECLFSQYVQEWSVPRENYKDVVLKLEEWLKKTGYKAHFPWEVRFVKGDNIFLSPAYGGDRAYINIICYRPYNQEYEHEKFFDYYESLMLSMGGRPHWAKSFKAGREALSVNYPEWGAFDDIRKQMDPNGVFMNEYLQRFFG